MIVLFAALVAANSNFTTFDRRQRVCERRFAENDFVEYAGCVVHAAEHEQREFKRLLAAAIHGHRITSIKFVTWARARDRGCKKDAKSIPNINLQPIGQARCVALADDRLLKSLQMKHR